MLGSGGTPFALLMPRSVDFGLYHTLLELNVPRARDVRLLLSLLQVSVCARVALCCLVFFVRKFLRACVCVYPSVLSFVFCCATCAIIFSVCVRLVFFLCLSIFCSVSTPVSVCLPCVLIVSTWCVCVSTCVCGLCARNFYKCACRPVCLCVR